MSKRELHALLRQDLAAFIQKSFKTLSPAQAYLDNWHIHAIAEHLRQCARGEITRLLITLPPRYGKSVAASVAFPAYVLGREPHRKILCASYSKNLADKLSIDCRTLMRADWYGEVFPGIVPRWRQKKDDLSTNKGGGRISTSVVGGMRGLGGDMVIIDDPHKGVETISKAERIRVAEWYDGVVVSRLDNKREGVIIIIMQRLHEDDLIGHVKERADWTELKIPAIAPERQRYQVGPDKFYVREVDEVLQPARETREDLEERRQEMGTYNYAAQFDQDPIPLAGNIFRRSWFRYYTAEERPKTFDRVFQSWDTGIKAGVHNDYSVCTTWGVVGQRYYLIDRIRERLEYHDLKRRVVVAAEAEKPTAILIEEAGSGLTLIPELRRQTKLTIIAIPVHQEKLVRALSASAVIEGRRVFLPHAADWLEEYVYELVSFDRGRFDDQVDSTSQFLNWIALRREPLTERPNPKRPPGFRLARKTGGDETT